jgi:hypothetical protein
MGTQLRSLSQLVKGKPHLEKLLKKRGKRGKEVFGRAWA